MSARSTKFLNQSGDADCVVVKRADLERLTAECRQVKALVSEVINPRYVTSVRQQSALAADLERVRQEVQQLQVERDHWRSRYEATAADMEALKQEKLELRCELQETGQQMSRQSEYCATLGATCCTLLWRVSRCEDSIQTILAGSKVEEFLTLVSNTLESYLHTYKDEVPQEVEDETQFVLALCGVITNIAAAAIGRDYLMRSDTGKRLVNTLLDVIAQAPNKTCAKMKNLILMALYNLSINQKGLQHICSRPDTLAVLAWILQDEPSKDPRLNSLRLAQSLMYEQTNPTVLQQAKEVFHRAFLQQLSEDPCVSIREVALEFIQDLHMVIPET